MKRENICPKCNRAFAKGKADGGLKMRAPSRRKSLVKTRKNPKRSARDSSKPNHLMPIRIPLSRECKRRALSKIEEFRDEDYVYEDKEDVTFSTTTRRRRSKKKNKNNSRGEYKCESCPRAFGSPQGLRRHHQSMHNNHKRANISSDESSEQLQVVRSVGLFRCPNCHHVFESDDVSCLEIETASITDQDVATRKKNHASIDLNLPFDLNLPVPLVLRWVLNPIPFCVVK